jgi:hypothetical protein
MSGGFSGSGSFQQKRRAGSSTCRVRTSIRLAQRSTWNRFRARARNLEQGWQASKAALIVIVCNGRLYEQRSFSTALRCDTRVSSAHHGALMLTGLKIVRQIISYFLSTR